MGFPRILSIPVSSCPTTERRSDGIPVVVILRRMFPISCWTEQTSELLLFRKWSLRVLSGPSSRATSVSPRIPPPNPSTFLASVDMVPASLPDADPDDEAELGDEEEHADSQESDLQAASLDVSKHWLGCRIWRAVHPPHESGAN